MHYIITEKNTTAKRISDILSNGKARKEKIGGIDAYEFDEKVVIGLRGHVVYFDFSAKYYNWSKIKPHELIDAELVKVPLKKDVLNALEHVARDADRITIATDYDREGELIGVEALNWIRKINRDVRAKRMRYSAITEEDIKKSFASMSAVDYNLAASAEARGIIDLIWGASLTRFISISANCLGDNFLSVGRVQSPTLALLVEKEKEIEKFVPRKYWELHVKIKTKRGEIFDVEHEKGRFWEIKNAEEIKSIIEAAKEGIVDAVKTSMQKENPPIPFNTTEFIRASSYLGYSPKNSMRIAESLYLKGLISYHRTDNTTYPNTLDLKALTKMFLDTEFGAHAKQILEKKTIKPTAGKKRTTDHPPIHPVSATAASLGKDEWKIYELIVRRFLATLSDPARWKNTEVRIGIGGEIFLGKGRELKKQGWRSVYPYRKKEEWVIPKLKAEEKISVEHTELEEKETKPPNRFSQASLIKKMENLELGTKSTRHEIISKLYERMYIQGNPVKPTKKGIALVDSLEKYASPITMPEMTKVLEEEMDEISEGRLKKEVIVEKSRMMLREVFEEMMNNEEAIAKSLKEGVKDDRMVGTCPQCGFELFLITSRKGKRFIGCSNYPTCNFSLPLPKNGRLLVTKDNCDKHPSLFKLKIRKKGKTWAFGCPYCNFLQWKDKDKGKGEKQ